MESEGKVTYLSVGVVDGAVGNGTTCTQGSAEGSRV